MASLGKPRSWVPYMNSKDCSQGFCSLYCPQWCYVVYPPPPPPFQFPDEESSTPSFSPLVIAIIGVLASAFLLVSYYTIMSKYCGGGRRESPPSERGNHEELDDNHDPSLHEPWHNASAAGLDEALIKSITCCKYKRGEGLVGATDCSVCLTEFRDGERIRLLPKCSHAFHVGCIDTWLKSHSNCPLCRAAIFSFGPSGATSLTPSVVVVEEPPNIEASSSENNNENAEECEMDNVVEEVPKSSGAFRALSDLGNLRGRHSVIEIIRDEQEHGESIRTRSVSMDHSFLLHMNQDEATTSKRSRGNNNKFSYRTKVLLHCVLSPIAMKRSFSSGRFSFSGRGRQGNFPV